ncbi:hypothetical protein [Dendronalium sp. ChiSLP03b]|uniref:hypothetical protein n=1 Tax=Dendronalium sp. ChiSLP03b TaxID=3075381 RepID=UPI002AD4EE36|nr:hypothetical protein [Dendronalium sp. ChiSLP03b]MDZ8206731.1 hypothetical protein [Dendronalium sp. ChiSLP03b]
MVQSTNITLSPPDSCDCDYFSYEECTEKILLPPDDPNAEVISLAGYKLVYVKGGFPKVYRVYKDDSMLGVIFQHLTHWSNAVDEIHYTQPLDAAIGLERFMIATGVVRAAPTEQQSTGS